MNHTGNISFREMQEKDILFISVLLNDRRVIASLHNAEMSYYEWLKTYNEYWKNDNDEKHFIIVDGQEPVGWMKLNGLEGNETAWIAMLVISPESQHKGIGRLAVQYAEDFIKVNGFSKTGIHTTEDNEIAQALYAKCGYVITEYGDCTTGDGAHRKGYTFMKDIINNGECQ